jgi:Predicted membrane protein
MASRPDQKNKHKQQPLPETVPANDARLIATQQTTIFQGMLPPPEVLRQYTQMVPDVAERLLSLLEQEQQQRHEQEMFLLKAAEEDSKSARWSVLRGDLIAVGIFLVCMSLGLYFYVTGASQWLVGGLVGTPLVTAITALLISRKNQASKTPAQNSPAPPKK